MALKQISDSDRGEPTTTGGGWARALGRAIPIPAGAGMARMLVERNLLVYRRKWIAFVTGFFEPVFYLFSIGVGIGSLVGTVTVDGQPVPYPVFVVPALVAASAMNAAVFDATFNLYFKLRYAKTYDAILTTPLGPRDIAVGEVAWSLIRGSIYSAAFIVIAAVAGYVHSWWAILAVPAATLISFTFSAIGMAASTWIRSVQDFDYISLVLMPMFLLSATFYPATTYPAELRWLVNLSPLYHGVELQRALLLGNFSWSLLTNVAVLLLLGLAGVAVMTRRLERLLLR